MKRTLFHICLAYLTALCCAILFPNVFLSAATAISAVAAGILLLCSRRSALLRKIAVLFLTAALSFSSFLLYHHLTLVPARSLSGKTAVITGQVLESSRSQSGSRTYIVRLKTINRKAAPRTMKVRLSAPKADLLSDYDEISCHAHFFASSVGGTEKYYLSENVLAAATVSGDIAVINNSDFSLLREICRLRVKMTDRLRLLLPDGSGNILSGILFGCRDYVDHDTTELFATGGISHLLAVSGLHLTILAYLLSVLLRLLMVPKIARSIATAAFTFVLMVMTGFSASIVRAGIMIFISLTAQALRRDYDSLTALGISAVIICIANPYALTGTGFQLSFTATLGLIASQTVLSRLRCRFSLKTVSVPRLACYHLTEMILPCFFAFLFTLPVSVFTFGYFPTYSPIVNFLLAPLLPALLGFSLSGALLSLLPPLFAPVYQPFLSGAHLLLSCVRFIAKQFSHLPMSRILLRSDLVLPVTLFICLLILIAACSKKAFRNTCLAALLSVILICTATVSDRITGRNTVELRLLGDGGVLIKSEAGFLSSGCTRNNIFTLDRLLNADPNHPLLFLSTEHASSADIAALTEFRTAHKIGALSVPKSAIASFETLRDEHLAADIYESEELFARTDGVQIKTRVTGKNSCVFYHIHNFKVAVLNIQSADNLPQSFRCNLLIVNEKALPFLSRYKSSSLMLSSVAKRPDYLKKHLSEKGITYLGDCTGPPLYLRQNKLYKKAEIFTFYL